LKCSGKAGRAYLLEAGATGFADVWSWVQNELDDDARVCSYDRAGLGASDANPSGFEPANVRRDLKAALDAAGESGPFILVGHSLGGIFVRSFAVAYPESVRALVLVDPVHEDQLDRLPPDIVRNFETVRSVLGAFPLLARLGLVHLWNPFAVMARGLEGPALERALIYAHSPRHLASSYKELRAWDAIMDDLRAARVPVSVPVLVISVGGRTARQIEIARFTYPLHRDLADHFASADLKVISDADHFSVLADRKTARVLADLIRGVLD
jgi:pimeloyl-ACP methyl ester carboxylesterase